MKLDNTEISKVLGQRVSAPEKYDSSILVRELRQNNRTYLNIQDENLPFVGVDLWNNWEISALTDGGLPVTGIAKILYSCDSKYIVESKSAKLYFNSFNMTNFGDTPIEVISNIEQIASRDLSEFLETIVTVSIRHSYFLTDTVSAAHQLTRADFCHANSILLDRHSINTDQYSENPSLLSHHGTSESEVEYRFYSTLLRSNCRVTNQPDAGDVYIYAKTNKIINNENLLKYIISFRNENHFHEEICEAIYMRLKDAYTPSELMVACYYVRRGSLDINPIRASHSHLLPDDFTDPAVPYIKTLRQ